MKEASFDERQSNFASQEHLREAISTQDLGCEAQGARVLLELTKNMAQNTALARSNTHNQQQVLYPPLDQGIGGKSGEVLQSSSDSDDAKTLDGAMKALEARVLEKGNDYCEEDEAAADEGDASKQANQGRAGVPIAVPAGERKVDAGSSAAAVEAVRRRSVPGSGSTEMEAIADAQQNPKVLGGKPKGERKELEKKKKAQEWEEEIEERATEEETDRAGVEHAEGSQEVQEIEKESDGEKVEFEESQKLEANAEEHEAEATEQQSQSAELFGGEGESGVLTGSCPEPASCPGAPEKEILLLKESGNHKSSADLTAGEDGMEDEGKESAVECAGVLAKDDETSKQAKQGRGGIPMAVPAGERKVDAGSSAAAGEAVRRRSVPGSGSTDMEARADAQQHLMVLGGEPEEESNELEEKKNEHFTTLASAETSVDKKGGSVKGVSDGEGGSCGEEDGIECLSTDDASEETSAKEGHEHNQHYLSEQEGEEEIEERAEERETERAEVKEIEKESDEEKVEFEGRQKPEELCGGEGESGVLTGSCLEPASCPGAPEKEILFLKESGNHKSSAELTAGEEGIEDKGKESAVEGAGVLAKDDETSKQAKQGRGGVPMAVPAGERKVDAGSSAVAGEAVRRRSVPGSGSTDMEARADAQQHLMVLGGEPEEESNELEEAIVEASIPDGVETSSKDPMNIDVETTAFSSTALAPVAVIVTTSGSSAPAKSVDAGGEERKVDGGGLPAAAKSANKELRGRDPLLEGLVPAPILATPSIASPPAKSAGGEERKVDGCGGTCRPCSPLDTCRPCCRSGLPSAALRSAGEFVSATASALSENPGRACNDFKVPASPVLAKPGKERQGEEEHGSNRILDETIPYDDEDEAIEDKGDTSKQGNQGREAEPVGERKVDAGNKEIELLKEDGNREQTLWTPTRWNAAGKQKSSAELTAGEEGIADKGKVSAVEGDGVLAMDDETSKQANQGRGGVPIAVPAGKRKVDAGSSTAAGDAVRRRTVSGSGSSDMETSGDVQLEESENPGRDSDYFKVPASEVLAKPGNGLGRSMADSQDKAAIAQQFFTAADGGQSMEESQFTEIGESQCDPSSTRQGGWCTKNDEDLDDDQEQNSCAHGSQAEVKKLQKELDAAQKLRKEIGDQNERLRRESDAFEEERAAARIQISTSNGQRAAAVQQLRKQKSAISETLMTARSRRIKNTAILSWRVFTVSRKHDKCNEKLHGMEQEKNGMLKDLDVAKGQLEGQAARQKKLQAAKDKVEGERGAEKEKVKALEAKMKETAGDLGEKLKEKEAELMKVKKELATKKTDLEAQLAAAKSESQATVEALKRELYAVTEERDKLIARCHQMERDMSDATTKASKQVKGLKEELDGMIKKKLEVEKELATEKAKGADELKERFGIATEEASKAVELQERNVDLVNQLREANTKNETLEQQSKALHTDLKDAKEGASKAVEMQVKVVELEKQLRKEETKAETLQETVGQLQKKLLQESTAAQIRQKEHDTCKEQRDRREQEKQGVLKDLNVAKGEKRRLEEKVECLEKQLREEKTKAEMLEQQSKQNKARSGAPHLDPQMSHVSDSEEETNWGGDKGKGVSVHEKESLRRRDSSFGCKEAAAVLYKNSAALAAKVPCTVPFTKSTVQAEDQESNKSESQVGAHNLRFLSMNSPVEGDKGEHENEGHVVEVDADQPPDILSMGLPSSQHDGLHDQQVENTAPQENQSLAESRKKRDERPATFPEEESEAAAKCRVSTRRQNSKQGKEGGVVDAERKGGNDKGKGTLQEKEVDVKQAKKMRELATSSGWDLAVGNSCNSSERRGSRGCVRTGLGFKQSEKREGEELRSGEGKAEKGRKREEDAKRQCDDQMAREEQQAEQNLEKKKEKVRSKKTEIVATGRKDKKMEDQEVENEGVKKKRETEKQVKKDRETEEEEAKQKRKCEEEEAKKKREREEEELKKKRVREEEEETKNESERKEELKKSREREEEQLKERERVEEVKKKRGRETPTTIKKDVPRMATRMGPQKVDTREVESVVAPTTGKRGRGSDCVRGSGGGGGRDGGGTTTTTPADSPMRPLVLQALDAVRDVGDGSGGAGDLCKKTEETPSMARAAKRLRPCTRKSILFVGFDSPSEKEDKGRMEAWVKQNGGAVALDAKECTVCVSPRIKTSAKFLSVIAKGGVPIASPLWLERCCKEKKWLDEDDFCLETDEWCKSQFPQEDQDQFPDIKRRALSGNPSPPIFKGLTFYRHESFAMPREELKGLIECAGGTLLANNPLKAGTRILASKPICSSRFTTHDMSWLKRCIVKHQLFDA